MPKAPWFCALVLLTACDDPNVYTLYRSSPTIENIRGEAQRVHVATFDAAPRECAFCLRADREYNRENCEIARGLFASQSGVTVVRYWCERGRFAP
jgi:hypothetical protein